MQTTHIQENIIALFQNKYYGRNDQLHSEPISLIFNQHSEATMHQPFDSQLLKEIIQHCRTKKQLLTPHNIGQTVSQAHKILKDRIVYLQNNNLVEMQKKVLESKKEQLRNPNVDNIHFHKRMIQLSQEINQIQRQIQNLENNQKTFSREFEILDRLFYRQLIKNNRGKSYQAVSIHKQIDPDKLTTMFYLSLAGVILQFLAVRLRPGFFAICIYAQSIYILLIGYYHKKAVMTLTLTNILSIVLDLVAVLTIHFLDVKNETRVKQAQPQIQDILHKFYKVIILVSIGIRFAIIVVSCPIMQPPIVKVYYYLFNQKMVLNTRLSQSPLFIQ